MTWAQSRVQDLLEDRTKVSSEQATVARYVGDAFVSACPGSGKTRTVGLRLAHLAAFSPSAAVAAVSHTNTAVEQIRHSTRAVGLLPESYFVGTLHAFMLRYVVYPFGHLYMKCNQVPRVVADQRDWILDSSIQSRGAPDYPGLRVYPWLFDIALDENGEGDLEYKTPRTWPAALTQAVLADALGEFAVKQKLDYWKRGLLTHSDALWVAYSILKDHAKIAEAIAARFDELVVDEIQDTGALQLACLELVRAQNVRPHLVVVGDISQAVYEWSGATPSRLRSFADAQKLEVLSLTANFRSSQRICDVTYRFSTRPGPDCARGPNAKSSTSPELWLYDEKHLGELEVRFRARLTALGIDDKGAAILAWSNSTVESLNGGKPAGPGNLHWLLTELGAAAVERDDSQRLTTETFRRIDRAVAFGAFGSPSLSDRTLHQREDIRNAGAELLNELPAVNGGLSTWNASARDLLARHAEGIAGASPLNVRKYMRNFASWDGVTAREALEPAPGMLARTIHDVKGESITAVMLVARKQNAEDWASEAWTQEPPSSVTESTRVAYVAMTRAEQLLVLAVPVDSSATTLETYKRVGFVESAVTA